ncbi:hypothetical protein B4113_1873 [Geobacillus sp. B4113_201601]|nr:hypothetical protein B4113_1873 [Geobacillus sp. B4113_201601]
MEHVTFATVQRARWKAKSSNTEKIHGQWFALHPRMKIRVRSVFL